MKHPANAPAWQKELRATVVQAKVALRRAARHRVARQDTQPSVTTVEDYAGKLALLDGMAGALEDCEPRSPLERALATYAANDQSFNAMRAPLRRRTLQAIRDLVDQEGKLRRSAGSSDNLAWVICVDQLSSALADWKGLQALTAKGVRAEFGIPMRRSKSKKHVAAEAEEGWMERYLEVTSVSAKYRAAAVLLGLCGMRPIELEKGVEVRRRGSVVRIKIHGGKVRKTAGQPWRTLFVLAERFPAWFLEEIDSGTRKFSAPADAMRSYLGRLSPKVFSNMPEGKHHILSGYVFRHAIASDLRQQGWSAEEIAAVLGELCGDTVKWYGLRWYGRKGKRPVVVSILRSRVKTARLVKGASRGGPAARLASAGWAKQLPAMKPRP